MEYLPTNVGWIEARVFTLRDRIRSSAIFLSPGTLVIVIEFDENNHTDLQVIKDWASNQHGVSCLKVVRVNEYRDTHGRRVRLSMQPGIN